MSVTYRGFSFFPNLIMVVLAPGSVASVFASLRGLALPPGYEDELYCPRGFCMRDKKQEMTGPRTMFHECVSKTTGETQRVVAWGSLEGEKTKTELVAGGRHHQEECGGKSSDANASSSEAGPASSGAGGVTSAEGGGAKGASWLLSGGPASFLREQTFRTILIFIAVFLSACGFRKLVRAILRDTSSSRELGDQKVISESVGAGYVVAQE